MPFTAARWVVLVAASIFSASIAAKEAPQDMGPAAADAPQTVSIILKIRDQDALDNYVTATVDPHSPFYHRFLSVNQFKLLFAPFDFEIKLVTDFMKANGITINDVYADNLVIHATGTVAQFNRVFSTSIHDFKDPHGRHFRGHLGQFLIPRLLQQIVLTVAGLDTQQDQYRPMHTAAREKALPGARAPHPVVFPASNSTSTGIPGDFTVGDVADMYGVNPLYARNITGKGRTVGIATLANFVPDDAYTYWSGINLPVLGDRITQVHVDGGGELSGAAGSGETALDVEQSGGLAPQARIIVYDAPNTEAGFLDVFYKAASDNRVDTLSVSWGGTEMFSFETALTTDTHLDFAALHQAFAEAAVQGISVFAASGDSGAFDSARPFPGPQFSSPLGVESPADDPFITAAGGTTAAATFDFFGLGTVTVPSEQVWGLDYLNPILVSTLGPDFKDFFFAEGGGGGVSFIFRAPDYQKVVSGLRRTEANQVWSWFPNFPDTSVQQTLFTVPAHFAGRNVPDISLNADPFTGFSLFSSTDGGWLDGFGGTSFVAPQLNGIYALLSQAKGSRLGLANPQLYQAVADRGYTNNGALNDIVTGDDWFYFGKPGYEPGAGLGTINAARLLTIIR
jgi:kumamolisin